MKLIINISDEIYQEALRSGYSHLYDEEVANAVADGTPLPEGHGRLIDADALADKLHEVSVIQRYEDIKIERRCTVADVLTSLIHDLKGTALNGYELCPTIIEADKEVTHEV